MDLLTSLTLDELLLKRRSLRRQLSAQSDLKELRIAILGGTTTNELVDLWEVLLLNSGFRPVFHQSDYGRFYEDAVLEPQLIAAFQPHLIYVHTCSLNLKSFPPVSCTEEELASYVDAELERFRAIWSSLEKNVGCTVIQNNFEPPMWSLLGNLDGVSPGGRRRFIAEINRRFVTEANARPTLILQDLDALSSARGLDQWFDPERWYGYKIPTTVEGTFAIASSLCALVRAMFGRSGKVLVLDLDNTLWGGVIGDDGADKIVIGRETPLAEAYTAFQEYCLSLRSRGILLAVCSKNDEAIAQSGFEHPSSVLKLEHFSAFKANWEPKHENLLAIAQELNVGLDSLVFVDDNPAERAIVRAQLPAVAVPEVGSDVTRFVSVLETGRFFETIALAQEDFSRAKLYQENFQRARVESKFEDYGEYLDSLEMTAEIDSFKPVYMERIAQLTNKTNQFNLTTRRYTLAEIETAAHDGRHIGLYCRLMDRFGDNGLVSVVLGRIEDTLLHLDVWLMSCRVLKRELEEAMLDVVVERAKAEGLSALIGYYFPTAKNSMVALHYKKLGFALVAENTVSGASTWKLDLNTYHPRSRHIRILETTYA
jgi:FkbH-like protein